MSNINQNWLQNKINQLTENNSLNENEKLLLDLAKKENLNSIEKNILQNLINIEKAKEKIKLAKRKISIAANQEKRNIQKARNHKLFNAAGLLIKSNFVNSKTGDYLENPAVILGALIRAKEAIEKNKVEAIQSWQQIGQNILNQDQKS